MDASCHQLAMEGERLLRAHDYEGAIEFFEAGLRAGTEDKDILSAIYNQLGNSCFYVGKYHKALEYHKKDLEIAEQLNDKQGMAKAYGNLGNTFKALKNYSNAVKCCESHLEITRSLNDQLGEGRACYNLGNVHHAIGKAKLSKRDAGEQAEGRASVLKAIEYYKTALKITAELKDVAGEGRAVGNLGNAYTAIGDYSEAIQYHRRRLKIANDANDLPARARACGNLGNAYSALGDTTEAIKYYHQSLIVAKESNNLQSQGQAFYCLGSSYNMQKNFIKAIEFFEQYLSVATALQDKSMQVRAWYNLRNAHHQLGDKAKSTQYHVLIQQSQPASQRVPPPGAASPQPAITIPGASPQGATYIPPSAKGDGAKAKPPKEKDRGLLKGLFRSGPRVELATPMQPGDDDEEDDREVLRTRHVAPNGKRGEVSSPAAAGAVSSPASPSGGKASDWLSDAIKQAGSQTQTVAPPSNDEDALGSGTDFFDMLIASQNSRLDDQRSSGPVAGVVNSGVPDEEFFDMLVTLQTSRLDEQRSPAPQPSGPRNTGPQPDTPGAAPRKQVQTIDDSMSFFEMLAVAKATSQS